MPLNWRWVAPTSAARGTREVERVADGERAGSAETSGRKVDAEELRELLLPVVLREHLFDRVLEGQVERLLGEVADDVGGVAVPERGEALLGRHTREAVAHASITGDLAGADERVGILRLDEQLHALNWRGGGLRHRARHTARAEVDQELHDA
jgi:hypothetical protein